MPADSSSYSELNGKCAFVTGGAQGIGRAIAHALARSGVKVAIADIDGEAAQRTANEIGENAVAVEIDVRERPSVERAFSEALKLLNYGGGDIIDAYRQVLSADGPAARKAMHRLADALSAKDSDTIFGFFVSHIGDDIAERARAAALGGYLGMAERLARLHSETTERLNVSQAYNLDRKQTLITVLGELKQQLSA